MFEALRDNIRKLDPTEANGFEGLMAVVLSDLTGRDFVLASAGSQGGRDGQSAFDRGEILFEAKRYDHSLPKDQAFGKVFEIGASKARLTTELFILGITAPVSAQHLTALHDGAEALGFKALVLAWPESGIPDFAVLLAIAPAAAAAFIASNTDAGEAEVFAQLAEVAAHVDFGSRASEISRSLREPSIAPAFALRDNETWLRAAFSDQRRSRAAFGQALSPLDASATGTLGRPDLCAVLAQRVFGEPHGRVTAILGADGNGKSWIFAQAWAALAARPLTLLMTSDDPNPPLSREACQEWLITKLLAQTGEAAQPQLRDRWRKHFARWRATPNPARARLVVCLDGLNQRPTVDWPRVIDTMSDLLAELGGNLVITCRKLFFGEALRGRIVSQIVEIETPEWTDAELDGLLKDRATSRAKLSPEVVRSLRNPRIFGIAAELHDAQDIRGFEELSVNRLLFEHIRRGAVDGTVVSPNEFAAEMRAHAREIVNRLEQRRNQGLQEFSLATITLAGQGSQTISDRFLVTAAGRFFEPIAGEADRYLLRDEGLPLALGLALVQSAKAALRQARSVSEALAGILDPIAALDRTGDALLGAVLAAVFDETAEAVIAPLVGAFVRLQNLDANRHAEFTALFNRAPAPFLEALEAGVLEDEVVANLAWLTDAAKRLRGGAAFEATLGDAIRRWLGLYSIDPARRMVVPDIPGQEAQRAAQTDERGARITAALNSLSPVEQSLLERLHPSGVSEYGELSMLAFGFLAGGPLAPFAESLRDWCFAVALNDGAFRDHHDDFDSLLRFNLADWEDTRDALRAACEPLRSEGVSVTGQRAHVFALRATGDSDDELDARALSDALLNDQRFGAGWRLVESYCASDPCDPASARPDNVDSTAAKYRAIEVRELRRSIGMTAVDHFYAMAQPGLARFEPEAAIEVLRAWADEALSRELPEFRLSAFVLENETAGLEARVASPYCAKARALAEQVLRDGVDKNHEGWVAEQFALCIAFPHMSGDEQVSAFLNHPPNADTLSNLCRLFRPVSPSVLEVALDAAVADGDAERQGRLIIFAQHAPVVLTARTIALVLILLTSPIDRVRSAALSLAATSENATLLRGVVESGWSAGSLDPVERKLEIFHGSKALVVAAEKGLISIEACLERVGFLAYEGAARRLGSEGIVEVAKRLDVALRKAVDFSVAGNLPNIELVVDSLQWPGFFDVSNRPNDDETSFERLNRLGDGADAWHERQRRSRDAVDSFERDLTAGGALVILQLVTRDLLSAIDAQAPAVVDVWADFLLTLDDRALNKLHNAALVIASTIGRRDAERGEPLFRRLATTTPHVRVVFGASRVTLDALTAWTVAASMWGRQLCFKRLDAAGNDDALGNEVLAAVEAGRCDVLEAYVIDRRRRPEPAHRARAAMVAGLSPDCAWARETVNRLLDEHGFLARAHEGAKYALERHQWSRHWAAEMRDAAEPAALWRGAVLHAKIVDGRFKAAEVTGDAPSDLIKRFGATLNDPIRQRIRKWASKRQSQLFGMVTPDPVFLRSAT